MLLNNILQLFNSKRVSIDIFFNLNQFILYLIFLNEDKNPRNIILITWIYIHIQRVSALNQIPSFEPWPGYFLDLLVLRLFSIVNKNSRDSIYTDSQIYRKFEWKWQLAIFLPYKRLLIITYLKHFMFIHFFVKKFF